MTKREFDRALVGAGFLRLSSPAGGTRFIREVRGNLHYVARENVHAGSWRLLLAVGDVPEQWPAVEVGEAQRFVEAESPGFGYFNDLDPSDPEDAQFDDSDGALSKLFAWFEVVGEEWLASPGAKSDVAWREEHKLLVRRDGVISVTPRVRKLPS